MSALEPFDNGNVQASLFVPSNSAPAGGGGGGGGGETGPTGPTGPQGETGPAGSPGGLTGLLAVLAVTTIPGTSSCATIPGIVPITYPYCADSGSGK